MSRRTRTWAHSALIMIVLTIGLSLALPLAAQEETYFPTTEWRTSTPEEQGMDSAQLAGFFETFSQEHFNLDSLLVIRNGYIVAEAYAPPFGQNMTHYLASTTKSFTGTLIGILLGEGYLESLDTPVLSLFPDRTVQNLDERKQAMTVRHLLTMQAGLDCDINTPVGAETERMWMASDDMLQFALDLPMASTPGTEFHYCNIVGYLLSAIISEKTGMSAVDFAAEKLFAPLGITEYRWANSPQGITMGASELHLTTRDMAKFGYLFLNGGMWNGQQIVPADYVKASISHQIATGWPDTGYGYLWWYADSISAPITLGGGGQYIRIDPDRDIIVVMTGGFSNSLRAPLQYPFTYFMESWTTADGPQPENAEALSQLEKVIAHIETPVASVQALPGMAAQVSGQNFMLMSPFTLEGFNSGFTTSLIATSVRFDFVDETKAQMIFTFADGQEWVAPIGLNGFYQVSESPVGMMGVRGQWHTENELFVSLKYVGDARSLRMDVVFVPGGIEIFSTEYLDGKAQTATGVMMQ